MPGFGAMGLALGPDKKVPYEQAEKTLAKAVEIGCTFWDTAVVYGAGENERYIGRFLKQHDCRDEIFLASKCGFAVRILSCSVVTYVRVSDCVTHDC